MPAVSILFLAVAAQFTAAVLYRVFPISLDRRAKESWIRKVLVANSVGALVVLLLLHGLLDPLAGLRSSNDLAVDMGLGILAFLVLHGLSIDVPVAIINMRLNRETDGIVASLSTLLWEIRLGPDWKDALARASDLQDASPDALRDLGVDRLLTYLIESSKTQPPQDIASSLLRRLERIAERRAVATLIPFQDVRLLVSLGGAGLIASLLLGRVVL